MSTAEPLTETAATETKFCNGCRRDLPLSEFRRKWKGRPERHADCNDCKRLQAAVSEAKKDRVRLGKDVCRLQRALDAKRGISTITKIINEVVAHYGGTEGFSAALIEQSNYFRKRRPGSRGSLRIFRLVLDLSTRPELQPQQTDVSDLSDDELAELTAQYVDRVAGAHISQLMEQLAEKDAEIAALREQLAARPRST